MLSVLPDGGSQARVSEALLSAGSHPIVRSFPYGAIMVFDHELRCMSAGGLDLDDLGLSQAMLEGHTIFEVFAAEVCAAIEPLCRLALAGEKSELDVPSEGRTFQLQLAPLRDENERIVAGMGFVQDVTAAREAERALRTSEERLRLAFQHAPIGKALITLDGHYEQVNQAMCEIAGYSEEELRKLTIAEVTHPDDLAADLAGMRRLLAGEATTYTIEKRYLNAGTETVWASKVVCLVSPEDGRPQHFISQVYDISERKATEHALVQERRRLRDAQAVGRVGSWELDVDTNVVICSDTLLDLYGVDGDRSAHENQSALEFVDPQDRELIDTAIGHCLRTGTPMHQRYRVRRADDGRLRWFDSRGEALIEDGRVVRVVGAAADVTDQVEAEAEAEAAHALLKAVVSASPDINFVYDTATESMSWSNRPLLETLGYTDQDFGGIDTRAAIRHLLVEAGQASFDAALNAASGAADGDILDLDLQFRDAEGGLRWFRWRSTPLLRDADGCVVRLVGALTDITDSMTVEMRLEHAALHDDLTGLPNRRLVTDRLAQALNRSEREGQVAVLFCDLDGFKRVNDGYGHQAGDAVLIETSRRMVEATRGGDTVGRMGGDEFVVICGVPRGADPSVLGSAVASRIEEAMLSPTTVDGVEHQITISSGICVAGQGESADVVLRNADVAMYQAKARGKNGHVVFDAALHADALDRDDTERKVRHALAHDLIEVFYQPIVDPLDGRVCSVEALLRIADENGRYLNTFQAVTVAERAGIITALDERVLRLACAQTAAWRKTPEHADLTVSVNRSATDIARPGLYDRIREALVVTGLDPFALTLELTETVLLAAGEHTITDLSRLRADGVGIAIDDFGTGYASLQNLAALPITCLKVDQSFTAGLPHDLTCTTILRASVHLAADLAMNCVIEGVETIEQHEALPVMPNLRVQGYLYGRPQSASSGLPTCLMPPEVLVVSP